MTTTHEVRQPTVQIGAPDLMRTLAYEVSAVAMSIATTDVGKAVSEEQIDRLLDWAGSDSLDWDGLWTATQAMHDD